MDIVYESPQMEVWEVAVEKGYFGTLPDYENEDFDWNN
jgi:hypothetical protein